jgi:hypothetical protein
LPVRFRSRTFSVALGNPVSLGHLLPHAGTTKAAGVVAVPWSCQNLNLDVKAQGQRKMARMAIRLSGLESEGRNLCNLVALRHPPEPNQCVAISPYSTENGLASLRPLARASTCAGPKSQTVECDWTFNVRFLAPRYQSVGFKQLKIKEFRTELTSPTDGCTMYVRKGGSYGHPGGCERMSS